jgi:hypothetical protein
MVPTIALTRWRIDMATRKKSPQTAAPAPLSAAADALTITSTPPAPPAPPPPSHFLGITRVANGFVAEVYQSFDFGRDDREKRVARTPAELGQIVAEWAAPTPKKR